MTPTNPKGKKFSWSPSAIGDYINCPRQWAAKKYYENLPYVETIHTKAGKVEHKHLELRMAENKPLPSGYARGEKYCKAFEKARGQVITEQQLAINRDMKFVKWFSKEAYGRCVIDIALLLPKKIACYDYKSGNIRENSLQLKINACFLSLKYPEVEEFVLRYIWLKHDVTTGENFKKSDIPDLWKEIFSWVNRMEESWRTETFAPKPSGLCRGWCGVSSCEFCGK